MSIDELRSRLWDVPGAERLQMNYLAGMQRFSISGRVVTVPASATESDVERAIRAAVASTDIVTTIPMVSPIAEKPKGKPMAVQGGFAASIKAMLDEARTGLEQAQADGKAKVGEAVGKYNQAKAATAHVTGTMAKTIADEADAVLSELGQISNDLGIDGGAQ
jgi:hypothetical protein